MRSTGKEYEGQGSVSERRQKGGEGPGRRLKGREEGPKESERAGAGESAFTPIECKDPALSEKEPTMGPGPRVCPAVEV